ncbi:MAG TPA: histidine kinase [Pedococcus sp.]|jgi:signal transduction histidine kinase|nr:histidine kinase [Pedococcus sp.]
MSRRIERLQVLDAAIAVGFALAAEIERSVSSTNVLRGTAAPGLDQVLVLVPVIPLLWRRRNPFAALLATTAALGLVGGVFHGTICFFGGLFALLTALYAASSYAPAPTDKVAFAIPFGLYGSLPLFAGSYFQVPSDLVFATVLTTGTWLAGQGGRRWRRQSHELAIALVEVEAARAAHAELAVQAERTRLARELHDIVTHGLSVVVLQANRARLELRDRPDEARDAIVAIESTGREALVEMRRLLGVLRRGPDSRPDSGLVPPPGLASLPTLLDRLRRAGLDVIASGQAGPALPRALDLTAYRIIQESLTNALRHAHPAAARIEISRLDGSLRLRVSSPLGQPAPPAPNGTLGVFGGQGLAGLRERVVLFGGSCFAGEEADGTFVVDVSLPVPEHEAAS